jgi:hypothetical protein
MFQKNLLPPSSGSKSNLSNQQEAGGKYLVTYLFFLLFDPEDGGSKFFQNTGELLRCHISEDGVLDIKNCSSKFIHVITITVFH